MVGVGSKADAENFRDTDADEGADKVATHESAWLSERNLDAAVAEDCGGALQCYEPLFPFINHLIPQVAYVGSNYWRDMPSYKVGRIPKHALKKRDSAEGTDERPDVDRVQWCGWRGFSAVAKEAAEPPWQAWTDIARFWVELFHAFRLFYGYSI